MSTNSSGGSDFSVLRFGERVCEVSLPFPGHHNVLNALAALIAAFTITNARRGHSAASASNARPADASSSYSTAAAAAPCDAAVVMKSVAALAGYRGIARRMQHVGNVGFCAVYDDYAHHPTAIRAVIGAMRQRFPAARLVVVFQPHTYSRTTVLLHEFADALSLADRAIVTAVYDARGEAKEGFSPQVSGQDIARLIGGDTKGGVYCETLMDATRQLILEARVVCARARSGKGALDQTSENYSLIEVDADAETETIGNAQTVFLCLGAGSSNQLSKVLHGYLLRHNR